MANKKDNIISMADIKSKKGNQEQLITSQKEATDGLDLTYLKVLSKNQRAHTSTRSSDIEYQTKQPSQQNKKRSVSKPNHKKQRNYSSSRKRNTKLICNRLIAAGMLSAAVLLGGTTYSHINDARLASTEYSLDDYDKSEIFHNTNDLIQYVAEDTYFEKNPDDKILFDDYYLESYNEASVCGSDVTLKLNYTKLSREFEGGIDSKSINVTLPKDFAKDVYLNYKDLRDSSRVSDEKKEKTAYWLKMNSCVTNLKDGLNNYIKNTSNKDYSNSAKNALKNSKIDHNLSKQDDGRDF